MWRCLGRLQILRWTHKKNRPKEIWMPAPLDPVIAQILPLLPLRDPKTMTPKSCRDELRALSDARKAAAPPPPVASIEDIRVKGAAGPLAARVYRNTKGKAATVVFFHG